MTSQYQLWFKSFDVGMSAYNGASPPSVPVTLSVLKMDSTYWRVKGSFKVYCWVYCCAFI